MLLVILHISAAGVILLITDALTVGGVVAVTFLIAAVPLLQPLNLLLPAQTRSILAAQTQCPPAPGVVS